MVDFSKYLSNRSIQNIINPVQLYDTLDRASDKGPLRPAQEAVLNDWFNNRRSEKDIIVKLHTGQGKTLIGLLMLQSWLNEKHEPVIYLCPNNYLVEQTFEQAKQFGISTCIATGGDDLPDEFLAGKKILITSAHKLFNGLTKFGLGNKSQNIHAILIDDAHACSDIIRDQCRIRIPNNKPVDKILYNRLFSLFADSLEHQGAGSFEDIKNEKADSFLPVPYWAWLRHAPDVIRMLSDASDNENIKFKWALVKDRMKNCMCVISGNAIEIEPYITPLNMFGTYWNASHRIFMSATVTNDAFLIKGLGLSPKVIGKPLIYEKEKWSGEKMIIIPHLIHEDLDREFIVQEFAKPSIERKSGVVAIVPSSRNSEQWKSTGAVVAETENIKAKVQNLRNGQYTETLVLVNRYDGIDLPDDSCRILIFDSKPYSENLIDAYHEKCRPSSKTTLMRMVRTIEQGLGRSVRGEKDYSVIIITSHDIVKLIYNNDAKNLLSPQLYQQLHIGLTIAQGTRDEINEDPKKQLRGVINQCLNRDLSWKQFYQQEMDNIKPSHNSEYLLNIYTIENQAELAYNNGDYKKAISIIQDLIDKNVDLSEDDKAWYLQEMARYAYTTNRIESEKFQKGAHHKNHSLLIPEQGVTISKLTPVSAKRIDRIIERLEKFQNYQDFNIQLSDVLDNLNFGVQSNKFEIALNDLGRMLGFEVQRPDDEWKAGPDNLWALGDNQYIVWECKNEVDLDRAEIYKDETGQFNNHCAWFREKYGDVDSINILIHPSHRVSKGAGFTQKVGIMGERELKKLIYSVRSFFKSFESRDFKNLSKNEIQELLHMYNLITEKLITEYTRDPR